MIRKRPSDERGQTKIDWLNARHSFSFGRYIDAQHMGHGPLRVINQDVIAPGGGFGEHPHKDMEIVTYMLEGGLEHRDSMGNGSVLRAGGVQVMTAGSGVRHSEFNASPDASAHLLQIWIQPAVPGLEPRWEERAFTDEQKHNRLQPIASPDGRDGSLVINQDATIYATKLDAGAPPVLVDALGSRLAWVQVISGEIVFPDHPSQVTLGPGDGAAIEDEPVLHIQANADAEFLVFDLP